jgi:hypothetical protein
MSRLRTRRVTIALCLVALAFVLSISSAGVLPLFSLVKLAPTSQQTLATPPSGTLQQSQTGTLVVKASFFGTTGSHGLVTGALVSLDGVGSDSAEQTMITNSSGEVQVTLATGNYSVRVSSPEFNATTAAQVYQSRITEIDLVANSISPPAIVNSVHPQGATDLVQVHTPTGVLSNGELRPVDPPASGFIFHPILSTSAETSCLDRVRTYGESN